MGSDISTLASALVHAAAPSACALLSCLLPRLASPPDRFWGQVEDVLTVFGVDGATLTETEVVTSDARHWRSAGYIHPHVQPVCFGLTDTARRRCRRRQVKLKKGVVRLLALDLVGAGSL